MKDNQRDFKTYISEDFEEYTQIGTTDEPYIASKELVEALNLSIFLQRPLLLKGEPGCGKTRFAEAVAYELYKNTPAYKDYYEEWHIKSTSKARDGLYHFDHIGRLSDAQLSQSELVDKKRIVDRLQHPEGYFELAELGRAFVSDRPKVVLIDEIDKADIDFPNDLLLELDRKKFFVNEVIIDGKKKVVEASEQSIPIIIITSNDERELPAPFLRRCLFHYIGFPGEQQLIEILTSHFNTSKEDPLLEPVVKAFLKLRGMMENDKKPSEKKVSTSELIDWYFAIKARKDQKELTAKDFEDLRKLPFSSILLKSWEDHIRYFKTR